MGKIGTNWYETGYSGAEREKERRDLGSAPRRFWLLPGNTKEVVFIDDSPFCIDEHSWRNGDEKMFNYATCLAKIYSEGCPADSAKGVTKADYIGHYTIVDLTGYTDKEGEEHKYELVEFCPKVGVLNKLKTKKETKGSLVGQMYQVARGDNHSPSTGDDFEHQREVDMVKLFEVVTYKGNNLKKMINEANGNGPNAVRMRRFLAHHFQIPESGEIPAAIPPFNYANLHAPLDPNDLRKAISGARGFQAKGTGGSFSQSEDVPF